MTLSIITCEIFVNPFAALGSIRTRSFDSTICDVIKQTVADGGSSLKRSDWTTTAGRTLPTNPGGLT